MQSKTCTQTSPTVSKGRSLRLHSKRPSIYDTCVRAAFAGLTLCWVCRQRAQQATPLRLSLLIIINHNKPISDCSQPCRKHFTPVASPLLSQWALRLTAVHCGTKRSDALFPTSRCASPGFISEWGPTQLAIIALPTTCKNFGSDTSNRCNGRYQRVTSGYKGTCPVLLLCHHQQVCTPAGTS